MAPTSNFRLIHNCILILIPVEVLEQGYCAVYVIINIIYFHEVDIHIHYHEVDIMLAIKQCKMPTCTELAIKAWR